MLKILINNEEVVCDKQLEIKEEMLSTSSCILNNCYPKSWENTKDYTSEYYYPKDYSKCLIYTEELIVPKEYTQIEYIQSTGTQYIDTNYYATPNTKIEVEYKLTNLNLSYPIFGNSNEELDGLALSFSNYNTLNIYRVFCGDDFPTLQNIQLASDTNKHTYILDLKNGKIQIDTNAYNMLSESVNPRTNNSINSILINAIRDFDGVVEGTKSRGNLYSVKIYENNVLVKNMVPTIRRVDNSIGMYDLITNTFYNNQGKGNFIAGGTNPTVKSKLLFSGVVKNTGNINLNPRYPHYCNLEVLDFKTFLSECDQLDFVINNKTITEAIEQVIQAVASYGFVVGNININDDTIIGAYSTQEKTPYDVFQYLADISQSRWYTRLVDENTVAIDFYDPLAMERGIDLDFSNNEFACENNIEDLSFNYGTYDYRNKQIMLSEQVYGGVDFEETIVSNGYNNSFTTSTPIGILKAITINGENATFATNEDKMIGIEADFYYTIGETLIEGEIYPTGTVINVIYTPLIKGREIINNTNEITRITNQIGRKGVISRYEKRNDILSSNALNLIGTSYLKYKGTPEINLTVKTKDIDLYNIGQIVYFNYPNIQELSQDYMVKSKKTKIINTSSDWNIWYTYILSSNFNSENAINYFDNQRAKSSGNIQKGDYITRNIDIEKNCNIIFSNPSAEEITILGDNILNSPLNSPFIK